MEIAIYVFDDWFNTCCKWQSSWMACSVIAREGISFTNDLLDQVVRPSEHFDSTIVLYTYQYYNKMKCMFEPCTCLTYCHIHLSVYECALYERKMHGTNYSKINFLVITLVCFNFVEIWAIQNFLHWNFPDLWYYSIGSWLDMLYYTNFRNDIWSRLCMPSIVTHVIRYSLKLVYLVNYLRCNMNYNYKET